MAIADTIQSMKTHTQNAYAKIGEKGGTVPVNKNLENLSGAIESIDASYAPNHISFYNYAGTEPLVYKNLDTSNVTTMNSMFSNCRNVTSLPIAEHLDTSSVTDMSNMFSYCDKLTSLNLTNFNTSNVTNTANMFNYCQKLTSLDISSFDFTNVTTYTNMFYQVPTDCEILVKDETAKTWITSKFTNLTNVKIKA